MKKTMVVAMMIAATSSAFADGFVCQSRNSDLNVTVYNNTSADVGTRSAAVMILSDPDAAEGAKTIARFTDTKGLLTNKGSFYQANVDLRFKDQKNKEMLIAGRVQLQTLNTVELSVEFSYAQPLPAGQMVNGELTLNTRAGDKIDLDVTCQRYLKD